MMPLEFNPESGTVVAAEAWTMAEIDVAMEGILTRFSSRLPLDFQAHIVLKPNLNNDLVALTGNSTDLRVMAALIEGLQRRGFERITIADGSNVGVERRDIDTFKRLRVSALAERLGVDTVNLNKDPGRRVKLHGGAEPRISKLVEECDFLISVPTIKTHVEAGLSCAMKNWVGIVVGQDKRQMHLAINRNIQAIHEHVAPDLVVVDGIIGMEGNGPGDGDPVRLGLLLGASSAPLCDLVVAKMMGLEIDRIPYLGHALERGMLTPADVTAVDGEIQCHRSIEPAPERSRLAVLSEDPRLAWLKRAARPLTDKPGVAKAAYRLGVIQDVYSPVDDGVQGVKRTRSDCGTCSACADACPTRLPLERIGVDTQPPDCIGCLYCWWVCPDDVITLDGPLEAMVRQADRYKAVISGL